MKWNIILGNLELVTRGYRKEQVMCYLAVLLDFLDAFRLLCSS